MESVKTILAIDDNRDILYTLEQIFNFQGWRPLLANGYEEADKLIKKEKIDLILVDYHMPGVDGISAVKEIRKKLPKVPIIVLTIEEEDRIVSKFMAAGADDYSLKPIKAVDLISRIKVHLQYHEKSQYYENKEIISTFDENNIIQTRGWGESCYPTVPTYKQENGYYCGPASLQMTLKHITGTKYSQSSLASSAGTAGS